MYLWAAVLTLIKHTGDYFNYSLIDSQPRSDKMSLAILPGNDI